jgi:hypothetical protein
MANCNNYGSYCINESMDTYSARINETFFCSQGSCLRDHLCQKIMVLLVIIHTCLLSSFSSALFRKGTWRHFKLPSFNTIFVHAALNDICIVIVYKSFWRQLNCHHSYHFFDSVCVVILWFLSRNQFVHALGLACLLDVLSILGTQKHLVSILINTSNDHYPLWWLSPMMTISKNDYLQ